MREDFNFHVVIDDPEGKRPVRGRGRFDIGEPPTVLVEGKVTKQETLEHLRAYHFLLGRECGYLKLILWRRGWVVGGGLVHERTSILTASEEPFVSINCEQEV